MPTTLNRSALSAEMADREWEEIETAISALRTVRGTEPAILALSEWQRTDAGHLLSRAERLVTDDLHGRDAKASQALAEALVRIGRATAFRQIAYRLD